MFLRGDNVAISSFLSAAVSGGDGSIGSLGDIVFHVSSPKDILTIDNYGRDIKARLASHEIIGSKPLTEFLGADVQVLSFNIKLSAYRGVNPREELERLVQYAETGEVLTLVLGGRAIGEHKWLLESVKESVDYFDFDGTILASTASITLREYVEGRG